MMMKRSLLMLLPPLSLIAACTSSQLHTSSTHQDVALSDGIMFTGPSLQGSGTMADPIDVFGAPTATAGQLPASDGSGSLVWGGNFAQSGTDGSVTFTGTGGSPIFHVVEAGGDVTDDVLVLDRYINTHNAAKMDFRKAKGTLASPTTVSRGDDLGILYGGGYDGTKFTKAAQIEIRTGYNVSTSVVPGEISLWVNDNAGTQHERFRVDSIGHLTSPLDGSPTEPSLSPGCGTGAVEDGTDTWGTITMGTSPATCVMTFVHDFSTSGAGRARPHCTISVQEGGSLPSYSYTTAALTITSPAAGSHVDYSCPSTGGPN